MSAFSSGTFWINPIFFRYSGVTESAIVSPGAHGIRRSRFLKQRCLRCVRHLIVIVAKLVMNCREILGVDLDASCAHLSDCRCPRHWQHTTSRSPGFVKSDRSEVSGNVSMRGREEGLAILTICFDSSFSSENCGQIASESEVAGLRVDECCPILTPHFRKDERVSDPFLERLSCHTSL